ncbi:MAG: hypothetical protein EOS36_30195 [Mesorhizobium sp.]|uniref:hypothetical protein n=1 Tax=Mesorhizobium sp. TaxID=1871066 RepID=UPI000FE469AB|nr:hypothetical protein [Mesorhizobium sp.]RWD50815.1 MAG: hypothetical protein EOS36_30195 [Mesorhizobium sp.]
MTSESAPRLVAPDNLKSGVSRASFYDPEINRSYDMMASHYGVGVLPARPRRMTWSLMRSSAWAMAALASASEKKT